MIGEKWTALKTKITDYGADCAGYHTGDDRGTLEAAEDAARELMLAVLEETKVPLGMAAEGRLQDAVSALANINARIENLK